jgi:hypothetical protein
MSATDISRLTMTTVPISLVWRKGAKLSLVRQALKATGLRKF